MKIALCSSFVPFLYGGGRNIVDWLETKLQEAGQQVEKVYLPQVDSPEQLFQQKMAYRWLDLGSADRMICIRPPAHFIPHPKKIVWFIHHIRLFYDLWDSPYRHLPDNLKYRGIRDTLHALDTAALREAKKIFSNSKLVSQRLKTFNQLDSEVLYPPILEPEQFYCKHYNKEIVCISRVEHHKRQHLLVEAMEYVQTPVHLRLCGVSSNVDYAQKLTNTITRLGLNQRVKFENRWISEKEKREILSDCLALAYLPLDEDSYGYPCLEASHASKPILTTSDSGGVMELVEDGVNGYVTESSPRAIAEAMDKLYSNIKSTKVMGKNAKSRLDDLNINWSYVLQRLLA